MSGDRSVLKSFRRQFWQRKDFRTLRSFRRQFWQRPRAHGELIEDRTVSFLELFYDLVYVVELRYVGIISFRTKRGMANFDFRLLGVQRRENRQKIAARKPKKQVFSD